jgi:RNA polymerase sigma factor (sigma-70 family)
MPGPWSKYLDKFAHILGRPRRSWSESETVEVWNSLASGPVARMLYQYALRYLRSGADAEDVLQGCLFELSMSRTYDPQGGGPKAFRIWVYGCLWNHICRFLKLHAREREHAGPAIGALDDATQLPWSDKGIEARRMETKIVAKTMLGGLLPRPREIVARSLRGETAVEIGLALGMKPGNVRQIISRATRDIRKRFGISSSAAP